MMPIYTRLYGCHVERHTISSIPTYVIVQEGASGPAVAIGRKVYLHLSTGDGLDLAVKIIRKLTPEELAGETELVKRLREIVRLADSLPAILKTEPPPP